MENTPFLPRPRSRSRSKSPRRKSLADVFEGLNITSVDKGAPAMEKALSATFTAKRWPNWTSSISAGTATAPAPRLHFTNKMDSKTRAYVPIGDDPRELFQKAMTFFENIQDMIQESGEAGMKIVGETLTKDMANAIFGSNAIE